MGGDVHEDMIHFSLCESYGSTVTNAGALRIRGFKDFSQRRIGSVSYLVVARIVDVYMSRND